MYGKFASSFHLVTIVGILICCVFGAIRTWIVDYDVGYVLNSFL
jgi:hypothetical protein